MFLNGASEIDILRSMGGIETGQTPLKEMTQPTLDIQMRFGPHGSSEDVARSGLARALSGADIYMPEFPRWSPEDARTLNEVSAGRIEPSTALTHMSFYPNNAYLSFHQARLEALYNTQVAVVLGDVPDGHPLWLDEATSRLPFAMKGEHGCVFRIEFAQGFAGTLLAMREYFQSSVAFHRKRDTVIVDSLLQLREDYRSRSRVRVLGDFGDQHRNGIMQGLRARGMSVHEQVDGQIDDGWEQVISFLYDRHVEPDDTLIAWGFLEIVFHAVYDDIWIGKGLSTREAMQQVKTIVQQYSLDESAMVHRLLRTRANGALPHPRTVLGPLLAAKGVIL